METKVKTLEEKMDNHITKEDARFVLYDRALFGDEKLGIKGVVEMNREMYELLMNTRHVGKFFGGFKGVLGWLLLIAAVIATLKGWWFGIISYLIAIK
jgi:hypothetical protein